MPNSKPSTQQNLISQECPEFSEVIRKSTVSFAINNEVHHFIRITPSLVNQLYRVIVAAMNVLGFAVLFILTVFLPEYIFNYSSKGEAFKTFFAFYILAMVAAILLIGLIKVLCIPRTSFIDVENRKFVFARTMSKCAYEEKSVDFKDVQSIELVPKTGLFGTNKVLISANDIYYIAAEYKDRSAELDQLHDWLKAITSGDKD